ncbi:MAG: Fic family protein [Verrucomicrobia bacterium]|nr:Fic family protein [Verrucomicrobiota bacterium]
MPLQIPDDELQAILAVVASAENGASVAELMANGRVEFKRRTLQRRLDLLCERGLLVPQGEGRGRRYQIPEPTSDVMGTTTDQDWLSAEAREIQRLVTQPPSRRQPVCYDPSFLTSYQPNTTFYLPLATRKRLAEMGQVGITDLPAGTYLRQILDRLLIDLAWNSSRLEGNTYSLLETQRLLELGESAEGKATQEAQMILNHKAAIEMLADPTEEIGFNRYTICNLHALLSDNLMSDPAACGSIRSRPVGISGTVFHPLEVPQQIEENFLLILTKASSIENPFEAAFFVMVQLPYLQTFEDVNKRVSRLAANIPMVRHNFCPLSFVDVEADDYLNALIGVYELQRIEYLRDVFVWAYARSAQRYNAVRQSLGDPDPFRLKYRSQLGRFVREVVQAAHSEARADEWIGQHAATEIPEEDRAKFIETVEVELISLHDGNIARYRLRPSEFAQWKSNQKP